MVLFRLDRDENATARLVNRDGAGTMMDIRAPHTVKRADPRRPAPSFPTRARDVWQMYSPYREVGVTGERVTIMVVKGLNSAPSVIPDFPKARGSRIKAGAGTMAMPSPIFAKQSQFGGRCCVNVKPNDRLCLKPR